MPDFIRLLPDSVANQIAAGEVIQRPASALKELMENAIDAGASQIKIFIKDAGRTLIQVIDNGTGMNMTDARMCFERHATSKIREARDLFAIRTLGFRGEALASIAAVAQVELRTRKEDSELGTCILIEGSRVKSQEDIVCPKGTNFQVRNLFYNVPARRNFLKSDTVEFRHILEEFQRVALVHPDIEFSLHHNDKPVFQLTKVNLRQRIVHVFGSGMNEKLLPVELQSEQVHIYGFVGKPEAARKTRGEQYFFANSRYIRHPYLHHAIEQAFEELIPDTSIPSYFIFIEVDPATIDVNIHPTKTEVNFQYGQLIYGSMRSAVKHALGMFSLSPTLDFDTEPSFDIPMPKGFQPKPPSITIDPEYNPFRQTQQSFVKPSNGLKADRQQWEKLYDIASQKSGDTLSGSSGSNVSTGLPSENNPLMRQDPVESGRNTKLFQVQNRFILANVKSGLMIVDQQKAQERILFERMKNKTEAGPGAIQRKLIPQTFQLSAMDALILQELHDELESLGFELADLGNGTFAVNSAPSWLQDADSARLIEGLLEDFKKEKTNSVAENRLKLSRIMARTASVRTGKQLQPEELQLIIDELFACEMPEIAPDGSKILTILSAGELEKLIR